MNNIPEIIANVLNAVSILLAGRNSLHTWWTGILGCLVFGWVFAEARLYADATLQAFFVGTSAIGWWHWRRAISVTELPVRFCARWQIARFSAAALLVALGYGWLLRCFTNAYAPFLDSLILAFSVLAQFLLMGRRVENWWFWILVNTIAVPLYFQRGLHLTALLYFAFWINAIVSLRHWRRLASQA